VRAGTASFVQAGGSAQSGYSIYYNNRTTKPEPKSTYTSTYTLRSIIPGRNHGKLDKEWPQATVEADISSIEFDSFDRAIAENRAMRRDLAQDSNE